ncbi:hypothetical protein [Pseudofrankia sp. BMG5.36]|uniref:hypothetical protein n=1 Tax=Pseudofrankia sp. BMG5.36 TaxID=1834512 RepID=UPI0008DA3475|nr:hypothetical protein [Pseudofrankia sp. BMG5.36]OHV69561.1 hypothetical protein BCD48_34715 [Pseudofrankia sp. BMG5.36]
MFELARVRLVSVGPKGARYQDVTLDLRNVGAPVSRPAAQPSMFDLDGETPAHTDVPRRPSPATVLFLENGGGKSVLIKLIFSVMLPGRRQIVGTTNTRVLENFVLARDVAHVVLEWRHVRTGQAVVVGKVSAWKGETVSSDPSRFAEAWYSFHPSPTLALDTLPVVEGDKPVRLPGFKDRLNEAHRADPGLRLGWETDQKDWTDHLASLGLDPELFRYQRRMNAGEGEAADAFTFRSDEAFVDWLLTAVTKEEEPRGLAELVDRYAARLSQRGGLTAERDFVVGALAHLEPLVATAGAAETARAGLEESRARAGRFAMSIESRHAHEKERLRILEERLETARTVERDADSRVRRLNRITAELRRTLAGLRLAAAVAEQKRLTTLLAQRQERVEAWRQTEKILALNTAREKAVAIRRVVAESEDSAAPALAARDAAARGLARGLLAVADAAMAEAKRHDATATTLDEEAKAADDARSDADKEGEQEKARAQSAAAQVAAVTAAVRAAVADGLLTSPDEDVAARAEARAHAADEAKARVGSTEAERDRLDGDLATCNDQLLAAEGAFTRARTDAAEAARRAEFAETSAADLMEDERLAALLGVDRIELDTDTPSLLVRLEEAIKSAENEADNLRSESLRDQRLLDTLGSGGLLPPADEIGKALALLKAAGITAWPGWKYLAAVPPDRRENVLRSHPSLVGGIVLNDGADLDAAERILTEARLWPRSVVAVGTTIAITNESAAPPAGIGFLVPPNPALFDADQAEAERAALSRQQEQRKARHDELTAQLTTDQELSRRLTAWRDGYPPGTLADLRAVRTTTATVMAEAKTAVDGVRAARAEANEALALARQSLPGLRQAEDETRRSAELLAALAARTATVPGFEATVRAANVAVATHERQAEIQRDTAVRLRREAGEARRAADDQRRVAATSRGDIGEILGAIGYESEPTPTLPVSALREAYKAAKEAYERVSVGDDLRSDLRAAERAEAAALTAVNGIRPESARALAVALLASPDGADAPAREAAAERCGRELRTADEEHTEQASRVGELRSEHRRLPPQEVTLEPPYTRPTTITDAETLVARAEQEWEDARTLHETARTQLGTVDREAGEARGLVGRFDAHRSALAIVMPAVPDATVVMFAGNVEEAGRRRADVLHEVEERTGHLDEADKAVRKAADALAYTVTTRFATVTNPVRHQIISVGRDDLPQHAAAWEAALRPRLATLEIDLGHIDRHRGAILVQLRGLVEHALGTLRLARRLSELPDGLGDWSGEQFLRITFETAEPRLLEERLGAVVDDVTESAAAPGGKDKKPIRRDGMSLLLRGVRAAMHKGVKVEILKPDAVLRAERVRVAEIGDVFSGGQLLTAAIILYCTMAALRSNDRGYADRRHAGVLFLDNPIGRASAGYLLELQLAVADALGVQLIYTTGLFDLNALSVFPLIIRLRNDADLRAGLKYLTVDELMTRSLAGLGEPDGGGTLTSTRVYTRPAPAGTSAGRPA